MNRALILLNILLSNEGYINEWMIYSITWARITYVAQKNNINQKLVSDLYITDLNINKIYQIKWIYLSKNINV